MLIVAAGAGATALWGLKELRAPGPLDESSNVVIEPGLRTHEIAELLEREGIVSHDWLFVLAAHATRTRGSLKAGEYAFPPGASMAEVLGIIRSGRAVVHKVTVPEGWTSAQVVESVNDHPALTGTIAEIPPEGSLLPDTYVFQRGAERQDLIERMQRAQQELLEELWPQRHRDLPITSKEEALILASIVEKETGLPGERSQVAAVFINRLRQNMRLQSDPTIIYGIVGGEARLGRPITRSDIAEETPYNTYRINGLPPTPIANPGREAIAAVLQPDDSDHLYFVADGTGGHAFAETYDEHRKNVQNWRQVEQVAREETETEAEATTIAIAAEADETVVNDDAVATPESTDADRSEAAETEPEAQAEATADSTDADRSEPAESEPEAQAEATAEKVERSSEDSAAAAVETESSPVPDMAEAAVAPDEAPETAADEQPPEAADRQISAAVQPKPQPPEPSVSPAPSDVPLPRPKPRRH